jgi:hypothetical protein
MEVATLEESPELEVARETGKRLKLSELKGRGWVWRARGDAGDIINCESGSLTWGEDGQ